ncbi:MAG: hypothetical protein GKR94_11595 [Gammaproteobacteria bacterium]|nr:hypothetical protein [Gammaproteobacteria bacterium]
MTRKITLYGVGKTRSARPQWTLLELGLPFAFVDDGSMIGSDTLRALNPMAKLPAIVIDGQALFESAAICTHLCDLNPAARLSFAAGSRERGLQDQWISFVLSELDAYLWSNAKHLSMYPEDKRVPAVVARNNEELHTGLRVLAAHLEQSPYLVAERFSVTDIVTGWTVNWARRMQHLAPYPALSVYLHRLFERPHCTLDQEG